MKIRLLQSRAGIDFSQSKGDEIEVDAAEARRMIEAGQAEAIAAPKTERAVKSDKATETR